MNRFLQILIAILGLVITGLLGWSSYQNEKLQTTNGLFAIYSEAVSVAVQTCDTGMLSVAVLAQRQLKDLEGGRDTALLGADPSIRSNNSVADELGEHLKNIEIKIKNSKDCVERTQAVQVVQDFDDLIPEEDPAAQIDTGLPNNQNLLGTMSENIAFQVELSKEQDSGPTGQYFAVLASYNVTAGVTYDPDLGVLPHFQELQRQAAGYNIELYRTNISDHFAIVASPTGASGTDAETARDLARIARREGWANDAFMQEDKNWIPCGKPQSVQEIRDC